MWMSSLQIISPENRYIEQKGVGESCQAGGERDTSEKIHVVQEDKETVGVTAGEMR